MRRRRVCVPVHSPVWQRYVRAGWVELSTQGTWVTMAQPSAAAVATAGADVAEFPAGRERAGMPSGRSWI